MDCSAPGFSIHGHSLGKNKCKCVSRSVMPNSLWLQPTRLLCPWDFPGKDTGVGCYFLLQGIFPTQGSNMGLLHCRQILYLLNYKGSSLLCLPPAEFPNPKTELMSLALQADSLLSEPTGKPKASRGNGIPAELFQILKDDAVKVLHSVCQQIWKSQQWL